MFCLLEKALYGDPGADRDWTLERDGYTMSAFKEDGWHVEQCMYDKCVLRYTAPVEQFGMVEGTTDPYWALAMTHTDDTDMIGTSTEVLKAIKARYAAKYSGRG